MHPLEFGLAMEVALGDQNGTALCAMVATIHLDSVSNIAKLHRISGGNRKAEL